MVVIVVSVGVRGPGVEDSLKGDPSQRWTTLEPGVFGAISVISFAFVSVSAYYAPSQTGTDDLSPAAVTTTPSSSTVPSAHPPSTASPA